MTRRDTDTVQSVTTIPPRTPPQWQDRAPRHARPAEGHATDRGGSDTSPARESSGTPSVRASSDASLPNPRSRGNRGYFGTVAGAIGGAVTGSIGAGIAGWFVGGELCPLSGSVFGCLESAFLGMVVGALAGMVGGATFGCLTALRAGGHRNRGRTTAGVAASMTGAAALLATSFFAVPDPADPYLVAAAGVVAVTGTVAARRLALR